MDSIVDSAALILTSISLLYSGWSSLFDEVNNYKLDGHYPDLRKDHERARKIYSSRAIPILTGSILSSIVFMPKVIKIFFTSTQLNLDLGPIKSLVFYDIPSASLILVEMFLIALSIHLGHTVINIRKILMGFEKIKNKK